MTHPDVKAFGAWAEQLIAESTGKHGKGIVPIEGEPLGDPGVYSDDRLFVYVGANLPDPEPGVHDKLRALEAAGHPVVRLAMNDEYDLGEQFYLWEIAVAAAGVILGINAFDQPNVQESKDNTVALLTEYAQKGSFDEPKANVANHAFDVSFLSGSATLSATTPVQALAGLFAQLRPHDYNAITAYIARNAEHVRLLDELRVKIRDARRSPRPSASARGFSTRPDSSTRVAPTRASSCRSSPTIRRILRFRACTSALERSSRQKRSATGSRSTSAAAAASASTLKAMLDPVCAR